MLAGEPLVGLARLDHPRHCGQVRGADPLPPLVPVRVAIHERVVLRRDVYAAVLPHAPVAVLLDGPLQGGAKSRDLRADVPDPRLNFFGRACHNGCLLS